MISAERLRELRAYFANKGFVQSTPRPTIAQLEKLLSQDGSTLKAEILPSGEVRATSGAEWNDAVSVIDELEAARTRIAELETEARAMSEALRYGEHAPDCDIEYEGRPCNCGLGTVTGSQPAAVRLTEDERDAIGFAIYVIDQDAGDWSDHGGTTQTHREYAAILRRLGGQTT